MIFGRFAQLARQLEGDGRGDLAKAQVGRRLQGNVLDFEIVFFFEHGADAAPQPLLQFQNHARASKILDFLGDFSTCGAAAPILKCAAGGKAQPEASQRNAVRWKVISSHASLTRGANGMRFS